MKLIVDSKIPFMEGFAEQLGEVRYIPGADICAEDVKDADALIVRTRTHCDRDLLEGSNVKFIATATIGYDHIDTEFLKEAGISWTNCPGCNATSVAQYVQCALLLLNAHGCWDKNRKFTPITEPLASGDLNRRTFCHLTLGIVGVGCVGKQVKKMAERLGFGEILLCDPPRADREGSKEFSSLEELAARCDIITFHTPLTYAPQVYPTYHLASVSFFEHLRPDTVIFNSGRGEVVDTSALKNALRSGKVKTAVIDTWENEPNIDLQLLHDVFLGTPHIAGYSKDGKANGTRMSLQAVARFFGKDDKVFNQVVAPVLSPGFSYYPEGTARNLGEELCLYDPTRDSLNLKLHPECFEKLRGDYPLRRECF